MLSILVDLAGVAPAPLLGLAPMFILIVADGKCWTASTYAEA